MAKKCFSVISLMLALALTLGSILVASASGSTKFQATVPGYSGYVTATDQGDGSTDLTLLDDGWVSASSVKAYSTDGFSFTISELDTALAAGKLLLFGLTPDITTWVNGNACTGSDSVYFQVDSAGAVTMYYGRSGSWASLSLNTITMTDSLAVSFAYDAEATAWSVTMNGTKMVLNTAVNSYIISEMYVALGWNTNPGQQGYYSMNVKIAGEESDDSNVSEPVSGSAADVRYAPSASSFELANNENTALAFTDISDGGIAFTATDALPGNQVVLKEKITFNGMHFVVDNFSFAEGTPKTFTLYFGADKTAPYYTSSWQDPTNKYYAISVDMETGFLKYFSPFASVGDGAQTADIPALKNATSLDIKGVADESGYHVVINGYKYTMVTKANYDGWDMPDHYGFDLTNVYVGFDGGCVTSQTVPKNYSFDLVSLHSGDIACDHAAYTATFEKATLTLGDDIGVNFKLTFGEVIVASNSTEMVFTQANGDTATVKLADAKLETETGYYVFSCNVAAKEMMDNINAKLMYDGACVVEYNYSVKQYADYLIANGDAKSKAMAEALLTYGAAAQKRFDYNESTLATDAVAEAIPAGTLDSYTATTNGAVSGITYKGTTAVLESKTALRHYFTVTGDISNYTFKVGETEVDAVQRASDGAYYVEIADIAAKELGTSYTVTVTDGTDSYTIACSVYTYIKAVVAGNTASVDVMTAAYHYCEAAKAYFAA